MMHYDIILLDADGTLLDFGRAETQAFERTMAQFGLDSSSDTHLLYHVINEGLWKKLETGEMNQKLLKTERFRLLFERMNVFADCEAVSRVFLHALGDGGFTLPGAEELCKTLHNAGCKLYIATNGVAETQHRRLALSGLEPYLSGLYISEEMGAHKPHAAYFDQLFADIGNPHRSRAIILGDSLSSDMRGGKNAGIATCWFNPYHMENVKPELCDTEIDVLGAFIPLVLGA